MNEFEYLYVFQYSSPAIYEIPVTENDDDVEKILSAQDLRSEDCLYMWTKEKLEIDSKE